jgi:tryptophan-rich sensory protein
VLIESRSWYRGLQRPPLTPPDWALAGSWSLASTTPTAAAWLAFRDDARAGAYDVPALAAYATQLGLALAWPLLFFGLRRPALALLDLCLLWAAVAVTVRELARRHRFAASLLLPYLGWISYAAALNAALWWRNR